MIKRQTFSQFYPIHVQIEVTWRCNWRCVHCYQDTHHLQALDMPVLRRLFKEMAASGTRHVIVTGGEPLVRSDIFEILNAIREQDMGITLYTNGHLVTKEMARQLGNLIANAELSLLAGDADMHDSLTHVKGSYQKTVQALQYLQEQQVPVVVKTPVLKPAYPTLKSLEAYLHHRGIEWLADPEISRSYAGEKYPLAYQLSFAELQTFFTDFPQFNRNNGFNADPGVRNGICLAGRQYSFIDALGNVYPCLNFKSACDVQQAMGHEPIARLGNVLQQSFSEIWTHAVGLQQIRSATLAHFTTCSTCTSGAGCSPCMALNYEENGQLFEPAPTVCHFTKAAKLLSDPAFIPAGELRRQHMNEVS